MRQRKDGKRVQNWHKPLGKGELKHRYKRDRNTIPEFTNVVFFEELKEGARNHEAFYYYDNGIAYLEKEYYYDYDFVERYYEEPYPVSVDIRNLGNWLLTLHPKVDTDSVSITCLDLDENRQITNINYPAQKAALERRLSEYLNKLYDARQCVNLKKTDLLDHIGDFKNLAIVRNELKCATPLLFSPFWVRSPKTWAPKSTTSLVDYLFVIHRPPNCLYKFINSEFRTNQLKWIIWFILIAQGASLKRAEAYFDWQVSSKFQYYFESISKDMPPIQACVIAEIHRLGGSIRDAIRILDRIEYRVDPTHIDNYEKDYSYSDCLDPDYVERTMYRYKSFEDFWRETVRWHIKHGDEITDVESRRILIWAYHLYTESLRLGTKFTWKKWSVQTVIQRSDDYDQRIRFSRYDRSLSLTWPDHDWNWEVVNKDGESWTFHELTSGRELAEEGEAMHHCVGSYAGACVAGLSAIFTLKSNGIRTITAEIDPRSKMLRQARGSCNRILTPSEHQIIHKWMEEVVRKCPI